MDQILLFAFGFVVFAISSAATVAAILVERHEEVRAHARAASDDDVGDRQTAFRDAPRSEAALRVVRGVG